MPTPKPIAFTVSDRGHSVAPQYRYGVRVLSEGSQFLHLAPSEYLAIQWVHKYQTARADGLTFTEAIAIADA